MGVAATFVLVCFAWIFFRADSLGQALEIIRRLPTGWDLDAEFGLGLDDRLNAVLQAKAIDVWHLLPAVLLLVEPVGFNLAKVFTRRLPALAVVRWAFYVALLMGILSMGTVEEIPFVYFQF